jgi:lipoprotein NlpD
MKYSAKIKVYLIALGTIVLAGVLAACSSGSYRAPVVELGEEDIPSQRTSVFLGGGPSHRVNEGESLYAIAWMYDLDYQALALANNIREPYTIFPGQELSLDITNLPAASSSTNTGQSQTQTISRNTTGNAQSRPADTGNSLLRWVWPAQGNIVGAFSSGNNENKGIDIAGSNGDPVLAAESGEVVYAGNGLLRYGELVIIKHNDQFLSAYAHNSSINVSEGDTVSRGQQIANLGSTGIDRDMLHFEIRLAGRPVDPQSYLPPR